jgi:phosphoglycolate phosphatase
MINKNIKHIIWDWNGTLFDDVVLCKDIMNNILKRFELPELTLEIYRSIFTFPVQDYYQKAGLDFNVASFEVLGKDFMDEYENRKYECDLHSGVREGLEDINHSGITQSILSAYHHVTLEEIVDHFKIRNYFNLLYGLDNIYAGGKTEIGKKLISDLPFKREEILLVGDTIHDRDVAAELGINVIIIANGHQDHERLNALTVPVFNDFNSFRNNGFSFRDCASGT